MPETTDVLDKEEIVVAIEPVAEEGKKEETVKVGEKDPAVADLVNQYKELEAQSKRTADAKAESDRRANAAEADAARARKAEAEARSQVVDSNLDTITTALASANSDMEAAERDIKLAGEAGDYDAQAKAHKRLAIAAAKAQRYDEAKVDLETSKAKKPAEDEPRRTTDPVEAYISGRTEPTANWLRSHRDFVTDPRKNQKLTAAHWDALGDGLTPDTTEYFDHVETFIGLKDAPTKTPTEADHVRTPAKKVAQRPVAPVANGGSSGSASGGTEVRLSQREATAATDGTHVWNYDDPSPQKKFKKGDVIGTQEMARRKLAMTKTGQYDRTYSEQ